MCLLIQIGCFWQIPRDGATFILVTSREWSRSSTRLLFWSKHSIVDNSVRLQCIRSNIVLERKQPGKRDAKAVCCRRMRWISWRKLTNCSPVPQRWSSPQTLGEVCAGLAKSLDTACIAGVHIHVLRPLHSCWLRKLSTVQGRQVAYAVCIIGNVTCVCESRSKGHVLIGFYCFSLD